VRGTHKREEGEKNEFCVDAGKKRGAKNSRKGGGTLGGVGSVQGLA